MTGAEKALETLLPRSTATALLRDLRALGFDLVKRKAATARTTKAGLVLSDGCKVKIDPNVNPDATDPAHIADLESFHVEIHALQDAHRAAFLARPAGDGLIDGTAAGIGRVTPRELVAGYVRTQQATYATNAERQNAQYPWSGGEFLTVPLMVTKDADGQPVYESYAGRIPSSRFEPIGAEAAKARQEKFFAEAAQYA